ncbi:MAG: MazG family protein [Clostridiaceae bacterium]
MLHIAGLGPGDPGSITIETFELLKTTRVVLRTKIHPTVQALTEWEIPWTSLDQFYEENDSFEDVYATIASEVLRLYLAEDGDLTYLVPGNPLIAEKSVTELIALLEAQSIEYQIHPAVSFIDTIMDVLKRDPIKGLLILDSTDLSSKGISGETDTIITQVYNRRVASEVKLALSDYLEDEAQIIYIRNAGIKGQEEVRRIPLWSLDRQEDVDHLTSVFIERESVSPVFNDFRRTIDALRNPGGCPWDREQTHESLRRYLIEEAYEVTDAITQGDMDDVREELGDVLLQVLLHSRIAQENGDFTINDVIRTVNEKMINRHPHVFGELDLKDSEAVLVNWENIKKTEKGEVTLADKLNKLPKSIPATMRAVEVAKKAESYGYQKAPGAEILQKLRSILAEEGPLSPQVVAELGYYWALLADSQKLSPEGLVNMRVDAEINQLSKGDK